MNQTVNQADEIVVSPAEGGQTLAAVLRQRLGLSWNAARALCEKGKVFLGQERSLDPSTRLSPGMGISLRRTAPTPLPDRLQQASQAIVYEDSQIVVVDKPAGISSVPYERGETGTAMDLIRDAWRAGGGAHATEVPLHIVHRIDKETSGLLAFAKTRGAERALQSLLRQHDIERRYLCVAHGNVPGGRLESYLILDRGDGLRGSTTSVTQGGKLALTDVRVLQKLPRATLCEVQLHTGKTHQIRIHLSEAGHPLVGERVYIRDYLKQGQEPLPSPRLLLHALTLGFVHPVTHKRIQLSRDPPPDFLRQLRHFGGNWGASVHNREHS